MQPLYDNVLVSVETEWKSEIKTESGVIGVVYEDEVFKAKGAVTKGVIVALPRGRSNHYIISRIKEQPQIGDIAYFHFNSISENSRIQLRPDEKPVYSVALDNIFCLVRGGNILMVGSRVLAEAIYDSDIKEEGGIKVKKTESGIITEINIGHNLKLASLVNFADPLDGDLPLPIQKGDKIVYEQDSDFENEIEGKKYFVMLQENLMLAESE